jgi:sugar/nucleoside kinase (ribokinase family)
VPAAAAGIIEPACPFQPPPATLLQGGGNCGNALTAAARLGLAPAILTKIGSDGVGDGILSEFAADGVDTRHVLRASGAPSPFTYIIVDRQGAPPPGLPTCSSAL